jgi:Activator of Hsp90 ATPase homolog 1-like protein
VADRGSSGNAASTGEYLETPKGQGGSDSVETAGARQALPLRISRAFPAPRALLFRAWSSSDHIERWFSPKNYTVQVAWVQMRVGGQFDVCMRAARMGGAHHKGDLCRGHSIQASGDRNARRRLGGKTAVQGPYRGDLRRRCDRLSDGPGADLRWSSIRPWLPRCCGACPRVGGGPRSTSSRRRSRAW